MDGDNFSNGNACYSWAAPVCPGDRFASVNYNYENTGWSYYVEYECTSGTEAKSSAAGLIATTAVTVALATISMF